MSEPQQTGPQKGFISRTWNFVSKPSARFSLGTLFIVGGITGVLFWGGFNWAMELSNTEAFCISCHEMRDNVYQELQKTIHFKNRSGVRAICSDCHVPKDWFHKVARKVQATNELYHKIMGTVSTKEEFEKSRLAMAERVWASMKASNSRECRNCHSVEAMDPHKQSAAAKSMFPAMEKGLTCIDCHKGIAHKLPKMPDESEEPEQKK